MISENQGVGDVEDYWLEFQCCVVTLSHHVIRYTAPSWLTKIDTFRFSKKSAVIVLRPSTVVVLRPSAVIVLRPSTVVVLKPSTVIVLRPSTVVVLRPSTVVVLRSSVVAGTTLMLVVYVRNSRAMMLKQMFCIITFSVPFHSHAILDHDIRKSGGGGC